jgi:hypothetical protein
MTHSTTSSATANKLSENLTLEVQNPLGIVAVLKTGYAALNARHGVELAVVC